MTQSVADAPPPFIQLAAHPIRWRLLRELVYSDRAVWELTDLIDEPQSLVSYHLRQLRDGGLVSARRSTADGRDTYYAIDLAACGRELQTTGGRLHPALSFVPRPATKARRTRVLFLCTGNSARSQMAAALCEQMSDGAVVASSAGSNPKSLHPKAVRAMQRRGIDISGNRAKHFDEFAGVRFHVVITLCDRVREVCPEFPAHPQFVHWSIPDPSQTGAFEPTAAELETRIEFLLAVLAEPQSRKGPTHAQR